MSFTWRSRTRGTGDGPCGHGGGGTGAGGYDKIGTRVVSNDGAFLYGRDTKTLGIAMPRRAASS